MDIDVGRLGQVSKIEVMTSNRWKEGGWIEGLSKRARDYIWGNL